MGLRSRRLEIPLLLEKIHREIFAQVFCYTFSCVLGCPEHIWDHLREILKHMRSSSCFSIDASLWKVKLFLCERCSIFLVRLGSPADAELPASEFTCTPQRGFTFKLQKWMYKVFRGNQHIPPNDKGSNEKTIGPSFESKEGFNFPGVSIPKFWTVRFWLYRRRMPHFQALAKV